MPNKKTYEKYLSEGLCGLCGREKEENRQHLTDCYFCSQKRKNRMRKNKNKYNQNRRVKKNKFNRYDRAAGRGRIGYIREKALFFDSLFPDGIYSTEKVIALGKYLKSDKYNKNTDTLIRKWIFDPKRFPNDENKYRINDYFNQEIFDDVGWKPIINVKVIENEECEYYAGVNKLAGISIIRWTDSINEAIHYDRDAAFAMSQISKACRLIKSVSKNLNVKVHDVQLRIS